MKCVLIALVSALVGGVSLGSDNETAVSAKAHITAQVGENTSPSGYRQLFVYSRVPLTNVQIRIGQAENWDTLAKAIEQDGFFIYFTPSYQNCEAGKTFRVRAVNPDSIQFVDLLVLRAEESAIKVTVTGESEEKHVAPVVQPAPVVQTSTVQQTGVQQNNGGAVALDHNTLYYGSSTIDPNTLAQARAAEMARLNSINHLGTGEVQTSAGTLWEGSGTNGITCIAQNGSHAIGEGSYKSDSGTSFHSRLYNSPTYNPTKSQGNGRNNGRNNGRRRR